MMDQYAVDAPYWSKQARWDCWDGHERGMFATSGFKSHIQLHNLIDLNDPTSYSFDHIVPVAKGGTNELHNLGLTTKDANMAKSDLTLEEFVDLCVKVAKHYGRI